MYKKLSAILFIIALAFSIAYAKAANKRSFEIEYSFKVTEIPSGSKQLDVWVPIPCDTEYQKITDIKIDNDEHYTIKTEDIYGNKIAHTKITPNGKSEFDVKVSLLRITNQ